MVVQTLEFSDFFGNNLGFTFYNGPQYYGANYFETTKTPYTLGVENNIN